MPKKFLVLGGGYFGFWGGGGADFIFMGARIFLRKVREGAEKRRGRWGASKVDKREKRTRENRSVKPGGT